MELNYAQRIATQTKIRQTQVAATIELLDAGNTLPFIARYRKEATGNLDEEQLRTIISLLDSLRKLDERRAAVLASIEEQGKLTPELQAKLLAAETITARRRSLSTLQAQTPHTRQYCARKGLATAGRPDPGAVAQPHASRAIGQPRLSTSRSPRSRRPWPAHAILWPRRSATTPKCAG